MAGDNGIYFSMVGEVMVHEAEAFLQDKLLTWSFITPLQCPCWDSICVALECLVAWVAVMGLKNAVILLCWWACVVVLLSINNFSLCMLSSCKKSPRCHWSSCSITLRGGLKPWLKRQWHLPLFRKKQQSKTMFFRFHSVMSQLANSFF